IQTLAHELESLLELARQHKLPITPAIVNIILEGADTLKQFVGKINGQLASKKPAEPILVPTQRLLGKIRAVLAANSETGGSAPVEVVPLERPSQPEVVAQSIAEK